MSQGAEPGCRPSAAAGAHQGVELRHLRYLVAVADAGTFTQAAEWMRITQPTLSQQIRRLEEMVGTPLLDRRRDGIRLTKAGSVLLEESRTVLYLIEHGVRRSQQAAGVGRVRLRVVLSPLLPEEFAADTAARLQSVAAAAGVDITWLEVPDAGFSLIRRRHADAAFGWVMSDPAVLPGPLDVMTLGEFEPEVWIPARAGVGKRGVIGLAELAAMDVIHGPRRASPITYDAWLEVLRSVRPRFEFSDPPLRHSLALAFAASAERLTAVLTGPLRPAGDQVAADVPPQTAGTRDMVRVRLDRRPLTATAAVAWSGDLPRHLQQVLFNTADTAAVPAASQLRRGRTDEAFPAYALNNSQFDRTQESGLAPAHAANLAQARRVPCCIGGSEADALVRRANLIARGRAIARPTASTPVSSAARYAHRDVPGSHDLTSTDASYPTGSTA